MRQNSNGVEAQENASRSHEKTDQRLEELEKRLTRIYKKTIAPLAEEATAFFLLFEKDDAALKKLLVNGEISQREYEKRRVEMLQSFGQYAKYREKYEKLMDSVSHGMYQANVDALAEVSEELPAVYADNYNEEAEEVSEGRHIIMPITIAAAAALLGIAPTVKKEKDLRWNRSNFCSIALRYQFSAPLKSIGEKAVEETAQRNFSSMCHAARSHVTFAENRARQSVYKAVEKLGIHREKVWYTVQDNRVRHEHSVMHGVAVPVSSPFIVDGEEMQFPGDKSASPRLWCNCRCYMRSRPINSKE